MPTGSRSGLNPLAYLAVSPHLDNLLESGLSNRWYDEEANRYLLERKYTSAAGKICRRFQINNETLRIACKLDTSWRLLPPINQQQ